MHTSQRIPQRPAQAFKSHFHHVAIFQPHAFSEAERVRTEEVNIQIARTAVEFELELK
jgi:hypothetical protein